MKVIWEQLVEAAKTYTYFESKHNLSPQWKDDFTHFYDFWSQIAVVILVTPKQEVERKSEWFCGLNFFCYKFKVEWENGVWTNIRFLARGFFVHMRQFHFDFYCFFDFLDRIFF